MLCNIEPQKIRRYNKLKKEIDKISDLPINDDIENNEFNRLTQGIHLLNCTKHQKRIISILKLFGLGNDTTRILRDVSLNLIFLAKKNLSNFKLTRVSAIHGNCRDLLYKWSWTESSTFDCGAAQQRVKHISFDNPI